MTTVEFFRLLLNEIDFDSLLTKHPFLNKEEVQAHFDCVFDKCRDNKAQSDLYELYTDGASKGNPGHSGIGYVIKKDGFLIEEQSKYIGIATNNIAEYTALIEGLKRLEQLGVKNVKVYSDSELMVKQVKGEYSVKNDKLKKLLKQLESFIKRFNYFSIVHIPRSKNDEADKLSKQGSMNHST